jgi:hypothetical protein
MDGGDLHLPYKMTKFKGKAAAEAEVHPTSTPVPRWKRLAKDWRNPTNYYNARNN